MEKRTVYISYLVILVVVLNYMYGFSDMIRSFQMWDWYLVVTVMTILCLLVIKYKQNQRKLAVEQYAKENDRRRIELNQLVMFEQLRQLNEENFSELLRCYFELQGFDSIEESDNPNRDGYHFLLWDEGRKIVVKYFKKIPHVEEVYMNEDGESYTLGEQVTLSEVREFYGVMQDYDIQADTALLINTGDFEEEALLFASRNGMEVMSGYDFYQALDEMKVEDSMPTVQAEVLAS